MADEVSKSGKFYDTQANKVVDSPPVEGIQLVAPGTVVTPEMQAQVELYENQVQADSDVETKADTSSSGADPSKTMSGSTIKSSKS